MQYLITHSFIRRKIAAFERSLPKSFKLLLAFGKGFVEMGRLARHREADVGET